MSAQTRWITYPRAMEILCVGRQAFERLVESGTLTVRRIPGATPKVREDEVLALAERSTTPAQS